MRSAKALKIGVYKVQIRVYYEDTDVGGVVYYANYLKFCERARSDAFFNAGVSPHQDNQFFVVKSLSADYISPAIFGDILDVSTQIVQIKKASIELNQKIYRANELLFSMNVNLVFLNNKKPAKIPENFTKILEIFKKQG
jgi:acyl-CoA thioester hydrolase